MLKFSSSGWLLMFWAATLFYGLLPFPPHRLKQWDNKNCHYLYYHSSEHRDCHRDHYIRPFSCWWKNRRRAITATAVVIIAGRTRFFRPSQLLHAHHVLLQASYLRRLVNVGTHNYTIVGGNPKEGDESYHTATLRFMVCIWNMSRRFSPATEKFMNQSCP